MTNLTTNIDEYMVNYIECNTIWYCTLDNGYTVYMDDYRPGRNPWSAWIRLKDYCDNNDVNILDMTLRFRSNHLRIESNKDGFFFAKMARGSLKHDTLHFYVAGFLEKDIVTVLKVKTPELIVDETEQRFLDECRESIIINKIRV